MNKYSRVIILDEENTSLGPVAAALLKRKFQEKQIGGIEIDDAGNVVLFPEPLNSKMEVVARDYNLDLSAHAAKPLTEGHFIEGALVIALDKESKDKAYSMFPNAYNVYTLKEFIGSSGDVRLPIGGTVEEYKAVVETVDTLLENFAEQLKEMEK